MTEDEHSFLIQTHLQQVQLCHVPGVSPSDCLEVLVLSKHSLNSSQSQPGTGNFSYRLTPPQLNAVRIMTVRALRGTSQGITPTFIWKVDENLRINLFNLLFIF